MPVRGGLPAGAHGGGAGGSIAAARAAEGQACRLPIAAIEDLPQMCLETLLQERLLLHHRSWLINPPCGGRQAPTRGGGKMGVGGRAAATHQPAAGRNPGEGCSSTCEGGSPRARGSRWRTRQSQRWRMVVPAGFPRSSGRPAVGQQGWLVQCAGCTAEPAKTGGGSSAGSTALVSHELCIQTAPGLNRLQSSCSISSPYFSQPTKSQSRKLCGGPVGSRQRVSAGTHTLLNPFQLGWRDQCSPP